MNDKVTKPHTAVEPSEEDFAKEEFVRLVSALPDNQYLQRKDCSLLLWEGAYLNDSIFKEGKYFGNRGLLKKITPFLNHMTFQTTRQFFETCKDLQERVVKKKWVRGSQLKQYVATRLREMTIEDWNSPQEDLLLVFTSGYNLYSQAISNVYMGEATPQVSVTEKPKQRFEKIRDAIETLGKYPRYAPAKNYSFNLGLLMGIYYFEVQWRQRNVLKTGGLVKILPTFLRYMNIKQVEVLLRQVNEVVFKLASIPPRNPEEKRVNGIWLLQGDIQLELFTILANPQLQVEKANLSLGFLAGFNIVQNQSAKSRIQEFEGKGEDSRSETDASQTLMFVGDDDYLDELKKRALAPGEKVAFLAGILFNRISYDEGVLLGTDKLKKMFIPYFKNLNQENLLLLLFQVIYTFFSIWVKTQSNNQFYYILPKILQELIDAYGMLENEITEAEATLAFMQGYDSFSIIYNENKQT